MHIFANSANITPVMEKYREKNTNMPMKNKMGTMPVGKLLFNMSLPMIISMLVQAMYNVVDSYFVAQISNDALTAVSLAYPIQMLMISVSVGTAIGMNSYMSRRLGAMDVEAANKGASNGLFVLTVSAIAFALLGIVIEPFFKLFTDEPHLIEMGVSYLRICMLFGLGVFLQIGCERILQSMGKTTLSMLTQLGGAIVNIILDPILIFGLGPFPELGIAGAAYATVIGQWFGMVIAILLVFCKKHEITVSFKGFRPCGKTIKEIYRVGLPSIIMQSIGSVMSIGMNAIFSRVLASKLGVAIMGVYFKVQSIIFMPLFGLTGASMSIFAYNYGAKNRLRFEKAWKLTLFVAMIVMCVGTAVFQIFPQQIVSLFDSENSITEGGMAAFRIISLHFPLAALSITASVTFQAIGKGLYSMFMSIIRQIGVLLPAALALALIFKEMNPVWWCFFIAELSAVVFGLISLTRIWRRDIDTLPDGVGA